MTTLKGLRTKQNMNTRGFDIDFSKEQAYY